MRSACSALPRPCDGATPALRYHDLAKRSACSALPRPCLPRHSTRQRAEAGAVERPAGGSYRPRRPTYYRCRRRERQREAAARDPSACGPGLSLRPGPSSGQRRHLCAPRPPPSMRRHGPPRPTPCPLQKVTRSAPRLTLPPGANAPPPTLRPIRQYPATPNVQRSTLNVERREGHGLSLEADNPIRGKCRCWYSPYSLSYSPTYSGSRPSITIASTRASTRGTHNSFLHRLNRFEHSGSGVL